MYDYFQSLQSVESILRVIIIRAAVLATALFTLTGAVFAQSAGGLGLHTVVIDPGHGGKDPGAISRDKKTQEKEIVLTISRLLKEKIEAQYPDVKVYLTRDKDGTFVPLIDRAKSATNREADLFISVHINANNKTTPNGYSVHLLGPSADKNKDTYAFNMDVCKRENEVILLEDDYSTTYQGFDPGDPESDIFLHLMHNAYREQSLMFAQLVDQNLAGGPLRKSNGVTQNNFAVLRLASMPAVLLELGFISNAADLEVLRSDKSLDNIAIRLCVAFGEYKKIYDESVGAGKAAPEKADKAPASAPAAEAQKAEPQPAAAAPQEEGTYYATQVLATKKKMAANDPFFKGHEWRSIYTGTLYKYFIGASDDVEKARVINRQISADFPDSFLVKVVDGACERVK